MAKTRNHLVKNIDHKSCNNCGGDHEFVSRKSEHAKCGTPVAFSREAAEAMATTRGLDIEEAVVPVPDDTVVVLDDSARKLKQQGNMSVPLNQLQTGITSV